MTDQNSQNTPQGESQGDIGPAHERFRRWRTLDDIDGLRTRVQRVMRIAEEVAYHPHTDTAQRLRACTTVQQCAQTALRLLEAGELEARVEALEAAEQARGRSYHIPTN